MNDNIEEVEIYIRVVDRRTVKFMLSKKISVAALKKLVKRVFQIPYRSQLLVLEGQLLVEIREVTLSPLSILHVINEAQVGGARTAILLQKNVFKGAVFLKDQASTFHIQVESKAEIGKTLKLYFQERGLLQDQQPTLIERGRLINLKNTFEEQLIENGTTLIIISTDKYQSCKPFIENGAENLMNKKNQQNFEPNREQQLVCSSAGWKEEWKQAWKIVQSEDEDETRLECLKKDEPETHQELLTVGEEVEAERQKKSDNLKSIEKNCLKTSIKKKKICVAPVLNPLRQSEARTLLRTSRERLKKSLISSKILKQTPVDPSLQQCKSLRTLNSLAEQAKAQRQENLKFGQLAASSSLTLRSSINDRSAFNEQETKFDLLMSKLSIQSVTNLDPLSRAEPFVDEKKKKFESMLRTSSNGLPPFRF